VRWSSPFRHGIGEAVDALTAIAGVVHEVRPRGWFDDALVINLSYDVETTLRHVDFGGWTIDLADLAGDYFLKHVEPIVGTIEALSLRFSLRRLCFFGLSKGGFSALLLSRLMAMRNPRLHVGAVALGPLTRLWPPDPRVSFPSYKDLLVRAQTDVQLAAALNAYGDQIGVASLPNLRWIVGYSIRSKRDSRAALALSGRSLTLLPVPLSSHGTLIPFLCQKQPPERVRRIVAAAARNGVLDRDLRSDTLSADGALMLTEIAAMLPLPTVPELVRHALSRSTIAASEEEP
jgi:hypothetical protein